MNKIIAWCLDLNKEEIKKGERYSNFYRNKEKNNSLEGYRQTKTTRAMLLLAGFLMIFSLSFISAFDFDNVKSYDPLTQTATITNAFGLGSDIAEIKLNTPHNNLVAVGNNKVAEFTITAKDAFNGAIDKLEFYNLRDKETEIFREYTLRYRGYEDVVVNDYITECEKDPKNATGEVCSQVISGTHIEQREIWTEKPNYDLAKDEIVTIGIFVEVKAGDRVEWIPTLFGVKIEEWAVWTASLNVGLNVYYSFDEGTGTNIGDITSYDNNGTLVGVGAKWTANANCKSSLGSNCVHLNGSTTAINMVYTALTFDWSNTQNVSILMWVRLNSTQTDAGNNPTLFDRMASQVGWYSLITDDDNVWRFSASPTRFDCFETTDLTDDAWKMLVAVRNTGMDQVKFYVNGLYECNMTDSTTGTFTGLGSDKNPILFATDAGASSYGRIATGFITEFGLWNRTLTDGEITDLYNGGNGLQYSVDIAPIIVLNTPVNNYNSSTASVTFNCSATDTGGVQNLTMYVDNVNVNTTTGGTGFNLSIQRAETLSEAVHNWSCNSFDDVGLTTNSTTQNLTIDLTAPVIKIHNPLTNVTSFTIPTNVNFNVTITETGSGLSSCVYYNNTANTTITCRNNATIGLSSGWNNLSYWATDYAGLGGTNTTRFFINLLNYTTSYAPSVVESLNHTIFFNISTTALTSSSANLTYNGVAYNMDGTSNGTHITYNKTLTAPFVASDTSFWINITATINGNTYLKNFSQLVYDFPSLNVTSTACVDLALNFSLYDEENLTSLNGTYEYNFIYGNSGNSSLKRSYGKIEDAHSFYACINASVSTNWTISQGEIFYSSPNYVERRYYLFNGTYIYNNSREISLYDLLTTSQTSFKLEIEDTSLNPYDNRYAQLVRYYPDLNEYKVVDVGLTDETGSSVIHVKTEDVDYRIGVYEQNGTLIKLANPIRMVCLVSPCTYTLKISPTETDYISFLNIDYTFTFNRTTNIWGLVYADTSGNTQTMNLTIWKLTGDNTINVCSTATTGASGALTCNTTGQTGTLKGEVYRSASPAILMAQKLISISSDAFASTWGLWLSMLLLIPIVFVFAFMSPVGMVVGSIVALIPALYFGSINLAIIGGIAVLGGIVLHFVKRIG